MTSLRHFLGFVLALTPSILVGQCAPEPEFVHNDTPIIKEITASKRTINLDEKGKSLRFSGDVRADWSYRKEKFNGINFRGSGAKDRNGIPIPSDELGVRFNFKVDYKCKDFYAISQIEWDNLAGIFTTCNGCEKPGNCQNNQLFGSGFCDYLCLKRMYIGMTVWKEEEKKVWLELGRKSLYYTFDSRIQYKARVDGVFGEYSDRYAKYEKERSSEFALRGGVFLVDQKSGHFAWAYEARIYNVCDSGVDFKYSMIDWDQSGKNACGIKKPIGWRFLNSQVTLDYNFKEKIFGKKLNLYSAFLWNHRGQPEDFTFDNGVPVLNIAKGTTVHLGNDNLGWYAGFIIGEVSKAGDLSFDCNYQWVELQAVPDCDNRGIGTGNFSKGTFASDRRGNGNFKGLHVELLYAITDNLQCDINVDISRAIKHYLGRHDYNKVEIEFIHAF